MLKNTCKNQMCVGGGNCNTCWERELDRRTTLEIENDSASRLLTNMFLGWLVVAAIGLIILTTMYL